MMNDFGYVELKKYFLEHNIKHGEVAEFLEMSNSTFSLKINRKNADFNLGEARAICEKYNLEMQKFFT